MIKLGRSQGWLKSSISSLPTWATFHGVTFNGIKIGTIPGLEDRGSSVIAERPLTGGGEEPLMTVPKDLILCKETIETHAKSDIKLRELLDALGDFGRVSIPLSLFPFTPLSQSFYKMNINSLKKQKHIKA